VGTQHLAHLCHLLCLRMRNRQSHEGRTWILPLVQYVGAHHQGTFMVAEHDRQEKLRKALALHMF
jgi:hypothetical protein